MQRRVIHRLIACLLAPVVLLVNAAPATLSQCGSTSALARKKCCGCCQASAAHRAEQENTARPCCNAKMATTLVAKAPRQCCCSQGQERSAPASPLPTNAEQLAKQALARSGDLGQCLSSAIALSHVGRPVDATCDIHQPPVRVRFSIWLI